MTTQLRCPYPEPRVMPWLDDRRVEPDEVVDVPDDLAEAFRAAGWVEPGELVVWPPVAAEQPEPEPPAATTSATGDPADTGEPPAPPVDAAAAADTGEQPATTRTTRRR